jgi:hypothetical protein
VQKEEEWRGRAVAAWPQQQRHGPVCSWRRIQHGAGGFRERGERLQWRWEGIEKGCVDR